ncbi:MULTISPECIES: hypothetical protein [unclassified Acidovorax]|uniref:hypothetical protein n=1 Tax=unclassified Acidovorax TaxID=2684926 RepID=UPI001C43BCA5|nr:MULTISPECIES: hypothetical protein [unclassified Acidovorax]MBV7463042.1 hypothetical protein [Acidovorax sp. sif0632]MBV7468034.1 hypothetical protein [Acidovorax sp. sif0613]
MQLKKLRKFSVILTLAASSFFMSNAQAAGWIDVGTSTFRFSGWACDPSIPNYSGWVHFYRDDNKFLGALLANIPRDPGVASACGDAGVHGFDGVLSVPVDYLDNNEHAVRAYFIKPDNSNFLLDNVKRVVFKAPPPPTISGCAVDYPGAGWVLTRSIFGINSGCPNQTTTYKIYTYVAGLAVGTQMTACPSPWWEFPEGWTIYDQGGPSGSQCYKSDSTGQPVPEKYRLIRRVN